jgi:hypothetical protein
VGVISTGGNTGLRLAKNAKNDEFYTRIEDIEKELVHYRDHFRDKVVFLNCDDPEWSNFWRYFELNFEFLGLKKLISTHYTGINSGNTPPSYKLELIRKQDLNGDGQVNGLDLVRTDLSGDGDFRSAECVALLDEADIVVTNPPFSLFREYIAQLAEHDKRFIIIGSKNAITYKDVWALIESGWMWLGQTPTSTNLVFHLPEERANELLRTGTEGSHYLVKNGKVLGRAPSIWFTNLDVPRRHEELPLFHEYNPVSYPTYTNFDAIEVSKVSHIPVDYEGLIGVPITFLGKHNPDQFDIVSYFVDGTESEKMGAKRVPVLKSGKPSMSNGPVIGQQKLYDRILIRKINHP